MIHDAEKVLALIERLYVQEAYNEGHVDALDEILAPDFVSYSPLTGATSGLAAYKESILGLRFAYPDLHKVTNEMTLDAQNGQLFTRWTLAGTGGDSTDEAGMPVPGRRIEFTGMKLAHIKDGKMIDEWLYFDTLDLLRQMGQVPEAEAV